MWHVQTDRQKKRETDRQTKRLVYRVAAQLKMYLRLAEVQSEGIFLNTLYLLKSTEFTLKTDLSGLTKPRK